LFLYIITKWVKKGSFLIVIIGDIESTKSHINHGALIKWGMRRTGIEPEVLGYKRSQSISGKKKAHQFDGLLV
jgi:hypothetical protein